VSVLDLGLRISLIGFGVTFLALGLVILVMELLVRIFPGTLPVDSGSDSSHPGALDADEKRRQETAVALAVGVALLEDQSSLEAHDPTLGKLLEE
jgi:Na+-transporting methylmalonyl-CoA/oxaloacetate decarboxylase gamma subunit